MKRRAFRAADPGALAEVVARGLGSSTEEARTLVSRGAVYLRGRRQRDAALSVAAGTEVLVVLEEGGRSSTAPLPAVPPLRVLHEDDQVLAVDKPAGLPAQPTPGRRHQPPAPRLDAPRPRRRAGAPAGSRHHRGDGPRQVPGRDLGARGELPDRGRQEAVPRRHDARAPRRRHLHLAPRARSPPARPVAGPPARRARGRDPLPAARGRGGPRARGALAAHRTHAPDPRPPRRARCSHRRRPALRRPGGAAGRAASDARCCTPTSSSCRTRAPARRSVSWHRFPRT